MNLSRGERERYSKEALAAGTMAGEGGRNVRTALSALQILKEKAKAKGVSLGEFVKGGSEDAGDRRLIEMAGGAKGLTALDDKSTSEDFIRSLKKMAPKADDKKPGKDGKPEEVVLRGTLDLRTGDVRARGQRV